MRQRRIMMHGIREHNEQGVTLVELMIALVVTSVLVAGGFAILTMTDKATRANDQVVGTQQNARLAMELIARDVKLAGFRMLGSPNVPVGGVGGNCTPSSGTPLAIKPVDKVSAASVSPNDDGPDTISLVVPRTSPGWTLSAAVPASPATSFTDIFLNAAAVTNMQAEGMADASNAYISIGGVLTGEVSTSSGAKVSLKNAYNLPVMFPAGTQVYLLQCVTYSIGTASAQCGTPGPCLLRTVDTGTAAAATTNIVDGIEDIQFAMGCDGCNTAIKSGVPDGVVDDWNSNNVFDDPDWQTNRVWAPGTFDPATIRLVQVNVVARQTLGDQGLGETNRPGVVGTGPLTISDHLHSTDAGYNPTLYKQFRRRVLTRTIDARNIEQ